MKNNYLLAILLGLASISPSSFASIELTDNLLFSAFGSTSVTKSDNKTPVFVNKEINDETCYDCDTTLGLQLDYHFLDNFSSSVQVLKPTQNDWSKPDIEWLYLGYQYNQFSTKIGKLRLPMFLDSEYAYVGNAFVSARPPQEVYDSILGITSYTGANFSWDQELTDNLSLTVVPYLSFSGKHKATVGPHVYEFFINKLYGVALDLNSINYRIHFASTYAGFDYTRNSGQKTRTSATLYSLGGEYNFNDLLLKAETYTSKDDVLNWYTQVAYNYKIFTPYISYGHKSVKDEIKNVLIGHRKGHSITSGIRFDVTPNISINTEYQYTKVDESDFLAAMFGAGQFTGPLVPGEKDHANIYTLMFNFIY